MSPSGATMHIGELAERTGLSLRTIRHYDEIGLLKPSARTEGGFRLYTDQDLEQLLVIRRMKPLGFSLEQMSELLRIIEARAGATGTSEDDAHAVLQGYIAEAHARREQLREQLEMADELLERLSKL